MSRVNGVPSAAVKLLLLDWITEQSRQYMAMAFLLGIFGRAGA
jgi:hypothetical protein